MQVNHGISTKLTLTAVILCSLFNVGLLRYTQFRDHYPAMLVIFPIAFSMLWEELGWEE